MTRESDGAAVGVVAASAAAGKKRQRGEYAKKAVAIMRHRGKYSGHESLIQDSEDANLANQTDGGARRVKIVR